MNKSAAAIIAFGAGLYVPLRACLQQRHDGLLYMWRDVSGLQLINQRAGRLADIIKRQVLG